jgi:hypothetical protein
MIGLEFRSAQSGLSLVLNSKYIYFPSSVVPVVLKEEFKSCIKIVCCWQKEFFLYTEKKGHLSLVRIIESVCFDRIM